MPRFAGSPPDSNCPWIAAWDPADEAFVAIAVAVVADAVGARLFQSVGCLSLLARYPAYLLVGRSFDNSEMQRKKRNDPRSTCERERERERAMVPSRMKKRIFLEIVFSYGGEVQC